MNKYLDNNSNNSPNVLDIILMKNKKYIILFSGLEISPIEEIVNDLAKNFNAIVLNYLHLELNNNLKVMNERVLDLISKTQTQTQTQTQALFIMAKSFPTEYLKIPIDYHFNIFLNKTTVLELDNKQTFDSYDNYQKILLTNKINKFIKIKKEIPLDNIIGDIFSIIIDDIEKKVYGEKYDKLNSKVYQEDPKQDSNTLRLYSNPKALSIEEKKAIADQNVQDELDEQTQDDFDDLSINSDEEDDILDDEILLSE